MTYIDRTDNFIRGLGIEAYRVGGSVRDEILGRRIKDADYMVRGATMTDLFKALSKTDAKVSPLKLRDGRAVGYRAAAPGLGLVEIALPRTEVSTGPGHRDFEIVVNPSVSVVEDAKRRDFTFNALYKVISHPDNLHTQVAGPNGVIYEDILDPLGGLEDIHRMRVAVTHADSFRDDPLRILRALRFISVLGYELSGPTYALMAADAESVTGLTANGYTSGTVFDEISKMLMGPNVARALRVARDTGVLAAVLPELGPMIGFDQQSKYHDMTTDDHTFQAIHVASTLDAPLVVRWALLFHDAGKPETAWVGKDGRRHYYEPDDETWKWVCLADGTVHQGTPWGQYPPKPVDHAVVGERLWREASGRMSGVPRDIRNQVSALILNHMVSTQGRLKPSKVRRMRVEFGDDLLRDLFMLAVCDTSGKGRVTGVRAKLERLAAMEGIRQDARDARVPATIKDLAVTGHDARAAGLEGAEIGRKLKAILDEVAAQPTERTLSREWQMGRLGHG